IHEAAARVHERSADDDVRQRGVRDGHAVPQPLGVQRTSVGDERPQRFFALPRERVDRARELTAERALPLRLEREVDAPVAAAQERHVHAVLLLDDDDALREEALGLARGPAQIAGRDLAAREMADARERAGSHLRLLAARTCASAARTDAASLW